MTDDEKLTNIRRFPAAFRPLPVTAAGEAELVANGFVLLTDAGGAGPRTYRKDDAVTGRVTFLEVFQYRGKWSLPESASV